MKFWIPDGGILELPDVVDTEDPLLAAMTKPIVDTCRTCGCVDDDHSRILFDRPCLNFGCIHECLYFDPTSHASSIVPMMVRPRRIPTMSGGPR